MSGESEGADTDAAPRDAAETSPEAVEAKAGEEPTAARTAGSAPEGAGEPTGDRAGAATDYERYVSYLSLFDFSKVPVTRAGWTVRIVAVLFALVLLSRKVTSATAPMLTAKAPAPIPTEENDDYRFRLPERTRREIFADLATAEIAERARAVRENTWKGHVWSREDDRGHFERVAARAAAAKYKISLTQVYLVLDEGLRGHWLGPDGKPLTAWTPPFNPRQNSW